MNDIQQNTDVPSNRYRRIISVSLPIALAVISQSLITLVDIAMVGRLTAVCVAAFGMGNACYFVFSSIVIGVNISVQSFVARREGEGNIIGTGEILNSGIKIGFLLGAIIAIVFVPASFKIFSMLNVTPEVCSEGAPYLGARLLSLPAAGINFAFYGFWHGLKRPLTYIPTLLIMHLSNVFFNWVLIFGKFGMPALGTFGAGIGSLLATLMGTIFLVLITKYFASERKWLSGKSPLSVFAALFRMVMINGMQQLFLTSAILVFLWIVSNIGVPELAIATVLMNFSLFSLLPCVAIGSAAGSFVGQSLGAQRIEEARSWGNTALIISIFYAGTLAIPLISAPHAVMSIFINDPAIVEISIIPALLTAAVFIIEAAGVVFTYGLIGAGYCTPVMITTALALWGALIPLSYFLGPYRGGGLLIVWKLLLICRIIQTGILAFMWKGKKWQKTNI